VTGVRYRLKIRLTPADAGQRVVIRWRRPSPGDGEQIADVLGILEENDSASFAVRTSGGALVVIPAARALAGKVAPSAPQNWRDADTGGDEQDRAGAVVEDEVATGCSHVQDRSGLQVAVQVAAGGAVGLLFDSASGDLALRRPCGAAWWRYRSAQQVRSVPGRP
jgi:hypothetical protein